MEPTANDTDLNHYMSQVGRYYLTDPDKIQLPSEILQKRISVYTSKLICECVRQ